MQCLECAKQMCVVAEQSVNACAPKTTTVLKFVLLSDLSSSFTGGSLSDMTRNFGPLPEPVMCRFTKQIFEGLAYLHSQVWAWVGAGDWNGLCWLCVHACLLWFRVFFYGCLMLCQLSCVTIRLCLKHRRCQACFGSRFSSFA